MPAVTRHSKSEASLSVCPQTVETTWLLPPEIPGADCIFVMPMHSEGTVSLTHGLPGGTLALLSV